MISIEVINTGTELTLGRVINTHLSYLAQSLFSLGLRVDRQATVPDGDEIRKAFVAALSRAQIIILTGGLGPTSDDITRDIVAEVMDRPLQFDPAIWARLEAFFAGRGLVITEMQRGQAMVPKGGVVLANPSGTAPGLVVPFSVGAEAALGAVILLPGPPREMMDVWSTGALPWIKEAFKNQLQPLHEAQLRILGVGEPNVQAMIEVKARALGVTEVGYCARNGEVDLRLIGPKEAVEAAAALGRQLFQGAIYSESDATMDEVVVELAKAKGCTVATAESCTGGYIAHRITNVPGCSEMFRYGWVTYSNEAKTSDLGVPVELLEAHGAVSEPVAKAMAEGALARAKADVALAVTGIAGPGGGTAEKPVGLVFLALAQKNQPTRVLQKTYKHKREVFKYVIGQMGLNLIREALLQLPESPKSPS